MSSDPEYFSKMSKVVPSERSMQQTTIDFDIKSFPSMSTILWLKTFLIKKLPVELVELILDHAEYWPHSTTIRPKLGLIRTPVKWRGTSSEVQSPTWPSPESEAMQEVLGYTLYSPLVASESSLTRAATLKKGLRRLVRRDPDVYLPPQGQHPVRMIVFEAVSQRYDDPNGKFCDVGIIREDDHFLEKEAPATESQRRNSSVFSTLRGNTRPSKPVKSVKASEIDKAYHLVAQRECWFPPGTKNAGTYVIKWRHDEDLTNENKDHDNEGNVLPTTTDFIKRLKVGDSIGLWAPIVRGGCIHKIDEVRLHVFWAV